MRRERSPRVEPPATVELLDQLIRFNESVDQLVAESVASFSRDVDTSRQLFLGILAHDLRTPLSAIHATAYAWLNDPTLRPSDGARAGRILRSVDRMRAMVADLLDFTRTEKGSHLPIDPGPCDLGEVFQNAVEEIQLNDRSIVINVERSGDVTGMWDCARMAQLASNLIGNAAKHGTRGTPVHVSITSDGGTVLIRVHNAGSTLSESQQRSIFNPLARRETRGATSSRGLGLGLYISKQIVDAHGGAIALKASSEAGTEVVVRLPRRPAAQMP